LIYLFGLCEELDLVDAGVLFLVEEAVLEIVVVVEVVPETAGVGLAFVVVDLELVEVGLETVVAGPGTVEVVLGTAEVVLGTAEVVLGTALVEVVDPGTAVVVPETALVEAAAGTVEGLLQEVLSAELGRKKKSQKRKS